MKKLHLIKWIIYFGNMLNVSILLFLIFYLFYNSFDPNSNMGDKQFASVLVTIIFFFIFGINIFLYLVSIIKYFRTGNLKIIKLYQIFASIMFGFFQFWLLIMYITELYPKFNSQIFVALSLLIITIPFTILSFYFFIFSQKYFKKNKEVKFT